MTNETERNLEEEEKRPWYGFPTIWVAIGSIIVSALVWYGEQVQINRNFSDHIADVKTKENEFNEMKTQQAVIKYQYGEILRRLDAIEGKLDKKKQ